MDCSTPGFPVHHHLPELAQTHVHQLDDAIRPSHPLSSPSPPAFNLSQYQGLFQGISSSHQVVKVLELHASASVVPMNIQDWFSLGLTGWISLQSKGLARVFSNATVQKDEFFGAQLFFIVQLSHPYMTTVKTIALTGWTFVGKVMSLLWNMLSKLVITFLPRSKCLLILWLKSPSAVILEPKKIKSDTGPVVSPSISHEVMGPDAMILVFWILRFKQAFSLHSFTLIKRLFSSSSLSAIRVVSSAYLRLLIFGYITRSVIDFSKVHILAHILKLARIFKWTLDEVITYNSIFAAFPAYRFMWHSDTMTFLVMP